MKQFLKYLGAALFILVLTGCGAGTAVNNIDNSNTIQKKVTLKQVEDAIKKAAQARTWSTKKVGNGHLKAKILRKNLMAEVDINFNAKGYDISYSDSKNLKYDEGAGTIHKRYNHWVRGLKDSIDNQISRIGLEPKNLKPLATLKKGGELNIEGKTVYINNIIPYAAESQTSYNVRNQCTVDKQLSDYIIEASIANGVNVKQKNNIARNEIQLQMEIINAGRGYVLVRGALVKGNKKYQEFRSARVSSGGAWGGYKSSCSIFGRIAKVMGQDITNWLSGPYDQGVLGDAGRFRQ